MFLVHLYFECSPILIRGQMWNFPVVTSFDIQKVSDFETLQIWDFWISDFSAVYHDNSKVPTTHTPVPCKNQLKELWAMCRNYAMRQLPWLSTLWPISFTCESQTLLYIPSTLQQAKQKFNKKFKQKFLFFNYSCSSFMWHYF